MSYIYIFFTKIMSSFLTILGTCAYIFQFLGIIFIFGGWETMPKRLRIIVGVFQCLFLMTCVGLTLNS